jgi:mannose/cellobiose epimerase-like protein (N-acyl-D-glucosamine 2-epimerase family)
MAFLLFGDPAHRDMADHGVAFLLDHHWDAVHGGFFWVLDGSSADGPKSDKRKWCYSVAFAILALSYAGKAGCGAAADGLSMVLKFAEEFYWEPAQGLFVDSFEHDMTRPAQYRGQNANMHMCEALIAAYEFTGESCHLERARSVAHRLTRAAARTSSSSGGGGRLSESSAASVSGWVVEHYTADWVADPEKNKSSDPLSEEYTFRPYGYQPGHSMEWAKLLLLLDRLSPPARPGPEPDLAAHDGTRSCELFHPEKHTACQAEADEHRGWMAYTAELLFANALVHGWDGQNGGGLVYTVDPGAIAALQQQEEQEEQEAQEAQDAAASGSNPLNARTTPVPPAPPSQSQSSPLSVSEPRIILDGNKYYWAAAEMLAAAGMLALRQASRQHDRTTAPPCDHRGVYRRAWAYALGHFVDPVHGGWFPMVNREGDRVDDHGAKLGFGPGDGMVKCYPSKTDYHPLGACFELVRTMRLHDAAGY